MSDQKKHNIYLGLRILAFALCCALCYLFLARFVQVPGLTGFQWQTLTVLEPDGTGTEEPFTYDVSIELGKTYLFTAELEDIPEYAELTYNQGANETALLLDGAELYHYTARQAEGGEARRAFYFSINIELPEGSEGKTLSLRYTPLDESACWLPRVNLQSMMWQQSCDYAYANISAIPAGIFAMAFLILAAMMFLNRRADWRLLPLTLAFLMLSVLKLLREQGFFFLPQSIAGLAVNNFIVYIPLALIVCHAALNLKRANKKALLIILFASVAALLAAYLVSLAVNGRIAALVNMEVGVLLNGDLETLAYWLASWAMFVCLASAAYTAMSELTASEAEKRALATREAAAQSAYLSLQENARSWREMRHEMKNHIAAMSALAHKGDTEKLTEYIDGLDGQAARLDTQYSGNFMVNAILQRYAAQAARANIRFDAFAPLPEQIGIEDTDMSGLLMNMLDNAVEAAGALPEETKPFVELRMQIVNGLVGVSCRNSCADAAGPEADGKYATTKADKQAHGFGIRHMKKVAEKYDSVITLSRDEGEFTVKTALNPKENNGKALQK